MGIVKTIFRDVIASLIAGGFLEALTKIDSGWGLLIGFILGAGDFIIYLVKGINFVTWLLEKP